MVSKWKTKINRKLLIELIEPAKPTSTTGGVMVLSQNLRKTKCFHFHFRTASISKANTGDFRGIPFCSLDAAMALCKRLVFDPFNVETGISKGNGRGWGSGRQQVETHKWSERFFFWFDFTTDGLPCLTLLHIGDDFPALWSWFRKSWRRFAKPAYNLLLRNRFPSSTAANTTLIRRSKHRHLSVVFLAMPSNDEFNVL